MSRELERVPARRRRCGPLERRPASPAASRAGPGRPSTSRRSRTSPAASAAPRGAHDPAAVAFRPAAGSAPRRTPSAVVAPTTTSTQASRARHGSGVAGQRRERRLRGVIDAAGQPLEGCPQRTFHRPSSASAHSAYQRSTPWWQLHDVRSTIRIDGCGRPAGSAMTSASGDDVEATIRRSGFRGDEALQEQVAELLVVAVELAVGRDQGKRRLAAGSGATAEPRGDPLAGEAVGIRRRLGLERDRRRQAGVVEHDDDRAAVADLDPVRPAGVDRRLRRLPRGEDRVADALLGGDSRSVGRSTAVSGSQMPAGRRPNRISNSRRPQRISVRRSAAEASGRIEWWNAWAIALPPAAAATNARVRRRVRGGEPRPERRPEVPARSARGCRARRSAGSTRRRPARSSRGTARPMALAAPGRSTDRPARAGRSGRGRRDGRESRTGRGLGIARSARSRPSRTCCDPERWRARRVRARSAGRAGRRCPGRRARSRLRSSRRVSIGAIHASTGESTSGLEADADLLVAGPRGDRRRATSSRSSWATRSPIDLVEGGRIVAAAEQHDRELDASSASRRSPDVFTTVNLDRERRIEPPATDPDRLPDLDGPSVTTPHVVRPDRVERPRPVRRRDEVAGAAGVELRSGRRERQQADEPGSTFVVVVVEELRQALLLDHDDVVDRGQLAVGRLVGGAGRVPARLDRARGPSRGTPPAAAASPPRADARRPGCPSARCPPPGRA